MAEGWKNFLEPEKPSDGGTAFPHPHLPASIGSGMSLRDWFAGMIMQGMQANPEVLQFVTKDTHPLVGNFSEKAAKTAYRWSDAMLAARSQEQKDA